MELYPKTSKQRLAISDYKDAGKAKVMMLYVPWVASPGHEHIELTVTQAKKLNQWLTKFLEENEN